MKNSDSNMAGKVAIVTGANSGIGKTTAEGLAAQGAKVVMVCRDRERAEAAMKEVKARSGNNSVELMLCDLGSQRSIRELAEQFKRGHDRLDVLVNNAGVFLRKRMITEEGFETTFAVNHLAYFLLTQLLLDLLKRGAPARIVNVASDAHSYGKIDFDNLQGERKYNGVRAYANSKLANIMHTYELARRLEGTRVTANCLHPGVVSTGIFRALPGPLESVIKLFMMTPEKGAETSIFLASSSEAEGVTGKYFVKKTATKSSAESYNEDTSKKLWDHSVQLTGSGAAV